MNLKNYMMQKSADAQRGVVLFFALIALVIMSLAAAALIRSVDTSVLIAGNLAFKQSATISADSGLVSATDWIILNGNNLTTLSAANGYYPTAEAISTVGGAPSGGLTAAQGSSDWSSGAAWTDATSRLATGSGLTSGKDSAGNTIRYIIQRMCRTNAAPTPEHCLMGVTDSEGNSQLNQGDSGLDALKNNSVSPMYRVTARVNGPKNTVSYIQAYVF